MRTISKLAILALISATSFGSVLTSVVPAHADSEAQSCAQTGCGGGYSQPKPAPAPKSEFNALTGFPVAPGVWGPPKLFTSNQRRIADNSRARYEAAWYDYYVRILQAEHDEKVAIKEQQRQEAEATKLAEVERIEAESKRIAESQARSQKAQEEYDRKKAEIQAADKKRAQEEHQAHVDAIPGAITDVFVAIARAQAEKRAFEEAYFANPTYWRKFNKHGERQVWKGDSKEVKDQTFEDSESVLLPLGLDFAICNLPDVQMIDMPATEKLYKNVKVCGLPITE